MELKRLIFVFTFSLFLIAASAIFFYLKTNKNTTKAQEPISKNQERKTNSEELTISPQIPKNKVIVDSATLSKNGFLVVRKIDDGQLSQIIEMSRPLTAGTHKNITISLGNADIGNSELIVMIYDDQENDGIFNDLDLPAINENGNMTARFVKTGKALPASLTEADSQMPAHNMPGMKEIVKVRYTDKGFIPDKIEISEGSMVEFKNESSVDMWVASADHPSHTKLPTFDQFRAFKKDAIYRYVFKKKGKWEFHDHISPSLGGEVVVL